MGGAPLGRGEGYWAFATGAFTAPPPTRRAARPSQRFRMFSPYRRRTTGAPGSAPGNPRTGAARARRGVLSSYRSVRNGNCGKTARSGVFRTFHTTGRVVTAPRAGRRGQSRDRENRGKSGKRSDRERSG